MVSTIEKRFKYFCVICMVVLLLILETECKGGRSGGGGSHSSSHSSSSHSSSSHSSSSGGSHSSSSGGSHSSYGGSSHPSYGGSSHPSYGGSSHPSYGGSSHPSYGGVGSVSHAGGYKPIGFDHVNQQSHNAVSGGTGSRPGIGFDHVNNQAAGGRYNPPVYHPYQPKTVVHSGGYVHYQPPTQLQYTPPVTTVHHTATHFVPVYQPTVIHSQGSGDSALSHGSSFVGGYLVGRLTSGSHSHGYTNHVTNNYYNSDNGAPSTDSNSYYTVHHYHKNKEQVPSRFSVPGEDLVQCESTITDQLCVPNTNAFCLKNGTIMCTTPSLLTTPCEQNSTERCVYSRIECKENLACNATANQTYVDFYLPCIANVTYVNNRVIDTNYNMQGSYELCVTAVAHPRKLESPFGAVVNFITVLGKWHLDQLLDIHNLSTPTHNENLI